MIKRNDPAKPLLCLMPGLGGSGRLFQSFISALNRLGKSESEILVVQYGNGAVLEDYVDAVLGQIPLNRPVSLVAESFSGPVAIAIMARPELDVGPSVLCNTFCNPPYRMLLPLVRSIPESCLQSSALTAPLLRWFCAGPYADQSEWAEILKLIEKTDRNLLKQQLLALRSFGVEHLLAKVDVPVLYLQSTQDRLIHERSGRRISAGLSDCVVETFDGPHLLLQTSGQKCAEMVLRHVDSNVRHSRS